MFPRRRSLDLDVPSPLEDPSVPISAGAGHSGDSVEFLTRDEGARFLGACYSANNTIHVNIFGRTVQLDMC